MAVAASYLKDYFDLARIQQMNIPPPDLDSFRYWAPGAELTPDPRGGPSLVLRIPRKGIFPDDFKAHPSVSVLDKFIRLAEVPESDFPRRALEFARQFGALDVCQHGKLVGHGGRLCPPIDIREDDGPWEPLDAWRRYSRQLLAVMRIAEHLQGGRLGSDKDWLAIQEGDPSQSPVELAEEEEWQTYPDFEESVHAALYADRTVLTQQIALSWVVNTWLTYGMVKPGLVWEPNDPAMTIHLSHAGLPGTLAIQLASALSQELFVCDGCGKPFALPTGKRRPRKGCRKWCPECGRLAQFRDYQQRKYQPKKGKKGGRANEQEARSE